MEYISLSVASVVFLFPAAYMLWDLSLLAITLCRMQDCSNSLFLLRLSIIGGQTVNMESEASSQVEKSLQFVWSHVLNLPHVALDQPFLSVGGDSISAMQVVGQCRKEGMGLGVQEVLRSRSITQLATVVKPLENSSYDHEEYFDEEFDLSPIQSLYFQRPNTRGHFNQSFYLRVTRRTTADEFQSAVEQIVGRHSMLRARFSFSEEHGWQQRLTSK